MCGSSCFCICQIINENDSVHVSVTGVTEGPSDSLTHMHTAAKAAKLWWSCSAWSLSHTHAQTHKQVWVSDNACVTRWTQKGEIRVIITIITVIYSNSTGTGQLCALQREERNLRHETQMHVKSWETLTMQVVKKLPSCVNWSSHLNFV